MVALPPYRQKRVPTPPTGLTRALFRLPTLLYQARLGWLLRDRFLLIQHVGRISGRRRHVVLEVVEHDAASFTVVSGYGDRSQWYRNLREHPATAIVVGRRHLNARAVPIPSEQGGAILLRYAKHHPRAIRQLLGFTGYETDRSDAGYRSVGDRLPFLRLIVEG
ncbi:MAG: nitroreductase family deazaflavin-dependent oxidoreductase [Candidatus Dormiibacterota bacterium]